MIHAGFSMLRPTLCCAIALVVAAAGTRALAADVSFGDLPGGATSTNVIKDVAAEICRDHLFDPAAVANRLPQGYAFISAAQYAREEPGVADLLRRNSKYATYAVGSLCFVSAGSFVVDGVRVHSRAATPMAFWWARAVGPRDPRMQGKVEWLQLASWYSRNLRHRERVLATDPMAQFVDLEVRQVARDAWKLRLPLTTETVEGEVYSFGPRKKRNAPQPGFMSVPFTGERAGGFWVITYFGHHHQAARGEWQAKGTGVFSNALQIPGEASVLMTVFQDGWSALAGVYGP